MVLGINTLRDALTTPSLPEGEATQLPDYFPVEPRGCEKHSAKLFECLAGPATDKAREMEKAGLHKVWYPGVKATPGDNRAVRAVEEAAKERAEKVGAEKVTVGKAAIQNKSDVSQALPAKDDNPLDACRTTVAYYKRCCDRELKKRHNWILTEPYRVQEEYRYIGGGGGGGGSGSGKN